MDLVRIFRFPAFYRGDYYQYFNPGAITSVRLYARHLTD
jgi:hypothetical protein